MSVNEAPSAPATRAPAHRAPRRRPWHLLHLVLIAAACTLGLSAAGRVDVQALTDLGLAPALPAAYWLGLGALTVAFGLVLVLDKSPSWVLAAYVAGAIALLPGLSVVVYGAARGHVSLRHAGIVENLARVGSPDRLVDAYFNWPGFFSLSTYLSQAMGLDSAQPLIRLAPLAWAITTVAVLVLLCRRVSLDRRVTWLVCWLVTVTNWVNQDYFAPQSLAFFLYLVILTTVFAQPFAAPWQRGSTEPMALARDTRLPAGEKRQVAAVYFSLLALAAAVVASHQLTPYALLLVLTGLVAVRRLRTRRLAVTVAVLTATWVVTIAAPFFNGRLREMVQAVGFDAVTQANLGDRLAGSTDHQLIVHLRLGLVLGLWLLCAAGLLRRGRRRLWDLDVIACAATPFLLLPLQPYGGEMLLRVYMFSLPFVAVGAAFLAFPGPTAGRRPIALGAVLVPALVVATCLGVITRYGNDSADVHPGDEAAAVRLMYAQADRDALLVTGDTNTPWKYQDYEKHDYEVLSTAWRKYPTSQELVQHLRRKFAARTTPSYVLITRSNITSARLYGTMPDSVLEQVRQSLLGAPDFVTVQHSDNATLVKYTGSRKARP